MCGNKFDGVFHKKTDEILEKEDFIRRIKTAKMLCQGDTLGDLTTRSGNTPLFRVKISGREYKVHADTTIEAIKEFYKNSTSADFDNILESIAINTVVDKLHYEHVK